MFKYLQWLAIIVLSSILVYAVLDANGNAQLLQRHLGGAVTAPINPNSVAGIAGWWDPSDAATVFTDTGCTLPATNGQTVACITDRSSFNCPMNDGTDGNGPVLTVVSPTIAYLTFSGTNQLHGGCTAIMQSVPRGIAFIAAQATSPATNPVGPVFWVPTATSGASRFAAGYALASSPVGWGLRGRALDASGGTSIGVAATSGAITETFNDIEYITTGVNMTLTVNPGATTLTGSTADGGNNTSPTPSSLFPAIGETDDGVNRFIGRVYQIIVYTPTSAMPAGTVAQLNTYVCNSAGISC